MRVFGILICLLNCFGGFFPASAQLVSYPGNPVLAGNGTYSSNFRDLFSFLNNPASLAMVKEEGIGISAENRYGLKELNKYVLTGIYGVDGRCGMGMAIQYEGDGDYNHSQGGIAYAKSLGRVDIGLRFNYNMTTMAGYGNLTAIGIEAGSIWKITEKFYSGIQVVNAGSEKLPSQYSVGMGYEVSDQLFISTHIIKEENKLLHVQAGLIYVIANSFHASIGINSSPLIMLGWQKKALRILVACSMHPQLGTSTALGLQFFGKKKNL